MVQCYCFQGYLILGQAPHPDQITLEFEASILNMLDDIKKEAPVDISTDFNVARSFSDQANEAVGTDVIALVIGFNVVYIYVLMMIGGFGCVQQKVSENDKMREIVSAFC